MESYFKNNKGSLLLEITIGLGIIALLITISIPNIRKYQTNIRLTNAARSLISELRYAQQLSITEQIPYIVEMDPDDDSYELASLNSGATTTIRTSDLPSDVSYQSIDPALVNMVIFNSFGGAYQSGRIILENTSGDTAEVNVKPSGYVQLVQ